MTPPLPPLLAISLRLHESGYKVVAASDGSALTGGASIQIAGLRSDAEIAAAVLVALGTPAPVVYSVSDSAGMPYGGWDARVGDVHVYGVCPFDLAQSLLPVASAAAPSGDAVDAAGLVAE